MRFFLLILKNLRRNLIRSVLTGTAVVFLVAIFSLIASLLYFLDNVLVEKTKDVKTIVSERYRFPSSFDRSYVDRLVYPGSTIHKEMSRIAGFHGENYTIWHFVICSTDPKMEDKDANFFIIATLPDKMAGMIDGVEGLPPDVGELVKNPPRSGLPNIGLVMGPDMMKKLNKRVGDVFKVQSVSHREGGGFRRPIEFEFEIVASFLPDSIWRNASFMDYAYLDRALKEKKNERDGKVNFAWLMLDDQDSAQQVAGVLETHLRELKSETMSSAMGHRMGLFGGMLFGIKWLLTPAIVLVMTVVLANSISITVRERMGELAIMKVLGFRRRHIVALVLGEGILVGVAAGLLSAGATYGIITHAFGGLQIGQAVGPRLVVPAQAIAWGGLIGAITAILAGTLPAWNASRIKVSDVFSKIA